VINERLSRARALLAEQELDLLLVNQGVDFRFLTGKKIGLTERLTALMVPAKGRPTIVTPAIWKPLLGPIEESTDVHTWVDGQEPLDLVERYLRESGARRVAVNEDFWSSYLLELRRRLSDLEFTSAVPVTRALRAVKSPDEIEKLAEACRRHDLVYQEFCASGPMTGRTEDEIQAQLRNLMIAHGLSDIIWIDVGTGADTSSPLHPGGDTRVKPGDPVMLDYAGAWEGYYGDICRMPMAGDPNPEYLRAYEAIVDAMDAAFAVVRPGVPAQEVDRAARAVIESRGFGKYFYHRLGHGIGLAGHEHPYIIEGNADSLQSGNTFSIEPGIYIAGNWGIRIEDIVAVTADGIRDLDAAATRELVILG
jgi:Xaa-Pro aminopeptidase